MLIIGHRGARGHAPENTLKGLDAGLALGCSMLEFDVQRVEDDLVLLHDPGVERTTNGHGLLDELDLATLRALDAGDGEQVPLLSEVLARYRGRCRLNIEIKSAAGTAELLASCLAQALTQGWAPADLLVSSFHHLELQRFRSAAPGIPIAPLLCGVPLDLAACATALDASALHIAADFAEAELIDDAHRRGMRVHAYTVNDPALARRLQKLGVDGLFSDYPDRLFRAMPNQILHSQPRPHSPGRPPSPTSPL